MIILHITRTIPENYINDEYDDDDDDDNDDDDDDDDDAPGREV